MDDRHSVRVRARWSMTNHKIDKTTPHAVFAFELRGEPRLEFAGTPRIELTKIVDEQGKEKAVQAANILPEKISPADANIPRRVRRRSAVRRDRSPESHSLAARDGQAAGNAWCRASRRHSETEPAGSRSISKSVGKTTRGIDGMTLPNPRNRHHPSRRSRGAVASRQPG